MFGEIGACVAKLQQIVRTFEQSTDVVVITFTNPVPLSRTIGASDAIVESTLQSTT